MQSPERQWNDRHKGIIRIQVHGNGLRSTFYPTSPAEEFDQTSAPGFTPEKGNVRSIPSPEPRTPRRPDGQTPQTPDTHPSKWLPTFESACGAVPRMMVWGRDFQENEMSQQCRGNGASTGGFVNLEPTHKQAGARTAEHSSRLASDGVTRQPWPIDQPKGKEKN